MTQRQVSIYAFTVEGSGGFPFDMLRYDQCWPSLGHDAALIENHQRGRRRIILESCSANLPTIARWKSFGWNIVCIGAEREPVEFKSKTEARPS